MDRDISRRTGLGLLGSGLATSLAGCAGIFSDSQQSNTVTSAAGSSPTTATTTTQAETQTQTPTATEADTQTPQESINLKRPPAALLGLLIPSNPNSYNYPVVGSNDASQTVTFYGGWKCPYTKSFVLNGYQRILRDYVQSGDLRIKFRAVPYDNGEPFHGPDEPFAAQVGQAVWHTSPQAFWRYFAYVFANAQQTDGWATPRRMRKFVTTANAQPPQKIISQAQSRVYQQEIQQTMARVNSIPIEYIPRIVVNGTVTAPTVDLSATLKEIENVL